MNGADDLPDPQIGKIRNYGDLPASVKQKIRDGILLLFDGEGVHEGAIDLESLWGTLGKFDRLYRVIQAVRAGKEVLRDGRISEVPGGGRLEALANLAGSYALPLRLNDVPEELVQEYGEIETLFEVLSFDAASASDLSRYPERVGDDLRKLLAEIGGKGLEFTAEAIRGGEPSTRISISREEALTRASTLDETKPYDGEPRTIIGKLFRVDTNKSEISIDVLLPSTKYKTEAVSYDQSQFETLRPLIDKEVTADVTTTEERRPYEHAAKTQKLTLQSIRQAAG